MVRSISVHPQSDIQFPMFWRNFLTFVAIGKSAVAGAGLALAALGALDIASAASASEWLHEVQKNYLNYAAIGGGITGALLKAFISR